MSLTPCLPVYLHYGQNMPMTPSGTREHHSHRAQGRVAKFSGAKLHLVWGRISSQVAPEEPTLPRYGSQSDDSVGSAQSY